MLASPLWYIPLTCCKCAQATPTAQPLAAVLGGWKERREQGCWLRKGISSPCTTPRGYQLPSTSPTQLRLLLVRGGNAKGKQRTEKSAAGLTWPRLVPIWAHCSHPEQQTHPPIWAPEPCSLPPPPWAPWLTLQEHGHLFSRQGSHQGSFRRLPLLLTCGVTLAHCSTSLALRNKGKAPSPQDRPNPLADRGLSLRPCGGEK